MGKQEWYEINKCGECLKAKSKWYYQFSGFFFKKRRYLCDQCLIKIKEEDKKKMIY